MNHPGIVVLSLVIVFFGLSISLASKALSQLVDDAAGLQEEAVVKPIRLGVRHGHEVIVNRQSCIANAFEQILEEKTPRFHKVVREIYDEYGLPVVKMIKSKGTADMVYVLMKPAEWFFLAVIYMVDINPENQIAIQYTGKRAEEFLEAQFKGLC